MALSVLQASAAQAGGASAAQVTITVTAGSILCVMVGYNGNGSGRGTNTISVADNNGNTYVQAGSYLSLPFNIAGMFYCKNANAGSTTVSVTVSANQSKAISVIEIAGADTASPLDTTASASNTASSPITSSSFTTANANEIVVAGCVNYYDPSFTAGNIGGVAAAIPSGAGSTTGLTSGSMFATTEYKIFSTTQTSITADVNIGAASKYANLLVATFSQAGGVAAAPVGKSLFLNQAPNRASTF